MQDTSIGQNVQLARTDVMAPDGSWFFVSTINRETSAQMIAGHRYAETMAWRLDPKTRERTDMRGPLDEDIEGSLFGHMTVVQRIRETGDPDEQTESE